MTTTSVAASLSSTGRLEPEAAGARLSELFARHGATVLGLCRLMLHHREEAEDAVQQTFLSAYRSLLNGVEPRHPAAWLATIARNECRSRREAWACELLGDSESPSTLPDPVAAAAAKADLNELWRAIAELPRHQRKALLLREFSGLSYVELATALAISEPAVESLLFRARRELRLRLRPAYRSVASLAPLSAIREALARAIGGMPDPGATGALAKIATAPLVGKLAAGAGVVVLAGGTVAAVENGSLRGPAPARAEPVLGQTPAAGPPGLARPSAVGGTTVAAQARRPRHAQVRVAHGPRPKPALAAVAAAPAPPPPTTDFAASEAVPLEPVGPATAPEPPTTPELPASAGAELSSWGDPQPSGGTGSGGASSAPGSEEQGGEETSDSGEPAEEGSGSSGDDGSSGSSGSGDSGESESGEVASGEGGSGGSGSGESGSEKSGPVSETSGPDDDAGDGGGHGGDGGAGDDD